MGKVIRFDPDSLLALCVHYDVCVTRGICVLSLGDREWALVPRREVLRAYYYIAPATAVLTGTPPRMWAMPVDKV